MKLRWLLFTAILTLWSLTLTSSFALAHAVYIFAWGEGEKICSESYFTKKSPVRQGRVIVYSQSGEELDRAATDDKGFVCFNRPAVQGDFRLVVEAGEGHRGEFNLRAQDLSDFTPLPPTPEPAGDVSAPTTITGQTAEIASIPAGSEADLDAIRQIVRQELASQLSPIIRTLSSQAHDETPSLKEIIGGLGWLLGIFGIAFWWSGKNRRQQNPKK
jgi:nickel transport protein